MSEQVPFKVGLSLDSDEDEDIDLYHDPTVTLRVEVMPIEPGDPTIWLHNVSGANIWFNWNELLDALERAAKANGFADFSELVLQGRLGPGPALHERN